MRKSRFSETEIVYAAKQDKMGYSATMLIR
jgi:hypothetical protein